MTLLAVQGRCGKYLCVQQVGQLACIDGVPAIRWAGELVRYWAPVECCGEARIQGERV
jgi:hypothetical protein